MAYTQQHPSSEHAGQGTGNPSAALEQTITLLKSKDDTSRFVGLSLLQSLLDSHEELRNDRSTISRCWAAMSTKFLKKLLQARPNDKRGEDEAKSMVTLAVAVIQAFTALLAPEALEASGMTALCESLVESLVFSTPESRPLSLRALSAIGSLPKGASAICQVKNIKPLVDAAIEDELARNIISTALALTLKKDAAHSLTDLSSQRQSHENSILKQFIITCSERNQIALLEAVADALEKSQTLQDPPWRPEIIAIIRKSFVASPSNKLCRVCTRVIHYFMGIIPNLDPFFPQHSSKKANQSNSQPFSYLFINFILVDIRSTIPSLMEILASPSYPDTVLRLAASYDVLTFFISILVHLPEADDQMPSNHHVLDIPPDLLLKLRKNLAETMSLTIEYLRDRWDAAVSGTSGLHPSALPTPHHNPGGPDAPLSLTWESPTVSLDADPVILAGSRTLSLWLHEDENFQLRTEAAGITDVLLSLYSLDTTTTTTNKTQTTDYKSQVLLALEGLTATPAGIEMFLEQNGWAKLISDLQACMRLASASASAQTTLYPFCTLNIIRVLLAVVESEETTQTKEEWLKFISFMANLRPPQVVSALKTEHGREQLEELEVYTAAGQLAVALLIKTPKRLRKVLKGDCDRIYGVMSTLLGKGRDVLDEETVEGLEEVIDGFGELSV